MFTNSEDAIKYVKEQNTYPAVIKADGLALGKGVILAESEKEAVEAIHLSLIHICFPKLAGELLDIVRYLHLLRLTLTAARDLLTHTLILLTAWVILSTLKMCIRDRVNVDKFHNKSKIN